MNTSDDMTCLQGRFLIGVDLGGTNCRMALVDHQGRICRRERFSSRRFYHVDGLMDKIEIVCREFEDAARDTGGEIAALGAGVPGLVDYQGRIMVAPNLSWLNGVDFSARLAELGQWSVRVINDANAIAWGEHAWGAVRDNSSFLAVTLGTGVGGGLVLGGRLWVGSDGAAGEFGHVVVEPDGRPCGCGSRGCLEQYASATGILRSVREELARGRRSSLESLDFSDLTALAVGSAAREGDALALDVLNDAGRRLGQGLAMIANVLNPEAVVICGGVSLSLDLMRPSLDGEMSRRAFEVCARRLRIVAGELGDDAGILGAAHIAGCADALWP
jgi:glucokinase